MTPRTFLHVGCGMAPKSATTPAFAGDGWRELRLDIDPDVQPGIVGSMTDMRAVADASCDAIFSSHNIEHLYPHEVPGALKEFRRVLKADGFLVITCPDVEAVCQAVLDRGLAEPLYVSPSGPITPIDVLWGHRGAIAAGKHFMAHRCGFSEKLLVNTLRIGGFPGIASKRTPNWALWAIASMWQPTQAELMALCEDHFPRASRAPDKPPGAENLTPS